MEQSILTSTKELLGINPEEDSFDLDITTQINAAFATLNQLGIGAQGMFTINDADTEWEDYDIPTVQLSMVKSYVAQKVRLFFDPPATSFHLTAVQEQIKEMEFRLNVMREGDLHESAN